MNARMAHELGYETLTCFDTLLYQFAGNENVFRYNEVPFFVTKSEGKWRVSYRLPRFPKYLEEPNYVDSDFCDSLKEAEMSVLEHLELLRSGLAVAHNITLQALERLHGRPGKIVD